MGMNTEQYILAQAKKGQGETNERLDALLTEQRRTNELLAQLLQAVSSKQGQT
jgi:hypothetical protein